MVSCNPSRSWLLTDARLAGHGLAAAQRLPPGSTIVLRSDKLAPAARRVLAIRLKRICRARRLRLLVAGDDIGMARRIGADGVHLRSRSARLAGAARRAGLRVSAPVHNWQEARAAARARIDYALISPLYATRSHPDASPIGQRCFIRLAVAARAAPVALGGMTAARHRALCLRCSHIRPGWAAIDAWEIGRRPTPAVSV
ncbi:MAG: thiamine phosphate synthase [Sphingopyxis sp.]|nr:thiamine phosphate synthase [Sphingopyxis sp.]